MPLGRGRPLAWGDHSEVQARANLRKAISRLRQALPGPARGLVDLDAGGLMVPVGALPVDVARFETLAGHRPLMRLYLQQDRLGAALEQYWRCLTWLLGIDPFRLAADVGHYAEGLRKAGFE